MTAASSRLGAMTTASSRAMIKPFELRDFQGTLLLEVDRLNVEQRTARRLDDHLAQKHLGALLVPQGELLGDDQCPG
jgi:hypothetical protein